MTGSATVLDRLIAHAQATPTAPAFTFTDSGTTLDYATLLGRVEAMAAALSAHNVAHSDRVALVLTTSPALVVLVFATQLIGAVPMIVNPSLPAPAIARRVALVGAALQVDQALAEILAAQTISHLPLRPHLPAPAHLAFLQLTSGTTGESRAAAVTHRALAAFCESSAHIMDVTPAACVAWVPLHHDLGLVRFLFFPVYFGWHCHLLPPSIASLGPWLRTLTATRAVLTGAPDFAYRLAARTVSPDGVDLSAVRIASNGAEPVRASSIAAFEAHFACPGVVRPGYGLAEATLTVSLVAPGEPIQVDARGTVGCGRVMAGLRLRVTQDGIDLPPNTVGELEVVGPMLFEGYYDPASATGFDRSSFTADGWLRTGDTGYVDAAGAVFVLGRTRVMVKQAGSLIAPREVEEVVDRVPGVRLSAAIGLPNAQTHSEELVVVAEARAPAPADLADAIRAALRAEVGFVPGRVLIVSPRTIPVTANGKLRHAALRATLISADDALRGPP